MLLNQALYKFHIFPSTYRLWPQICIRALPPRLANLLSGRWFMVCSLECDLQLHLPFKFNLVPWWKRLSLTLACARQIGKSREHFLYSSFYNGPKAHAKLKHKVGWSLEMRVSPVSTVYALRGKRLGSRQSALWILLIKKRWKFFFQFPWSIKLIWSPDRN